MNATLERFSLTSIKRWILRLFGRPRDIPVLVAPLPEHQAIEPDQAIRPVQETPPSRPKKQRIKSARHDMGSLLDSLAETFKHLDSGIDSYTFSRMLKSEVEGLKKCAPLVTSKSLFQQPDPLTKIDPKRGLPAYFVVAMNSGHDDEKSETLEPDFAFGMRVKKAPWNVTRMTGTIYNFGLAWRVGAGKHLWLGYWLAIRKDGTIQVAHELHDVNRSYPVRQTDGKKTHTTTRNYTTRTWEYSSWRAGSENAHDSVVHCFCAALDVYQTRNEKWNVGVSKGSKRLVFLIEQQDAKHYFKNRKKAVTVNGKTKPIIHFVRSHTQTHGDKVVEIPEHIRGLREFDWNEYRCAITAPKFHAYLSTTLELDADYLPEEDEDPAKNLSIGALADMMNDLEDKDNKRIKRAA